MHRIERRDTRIAALVALVAAGWVPLSMNAFSQTEGPTLTIHVSPRGDDVAGKGTQRSPFAALARAIEAARDRRSAGKAVRIRLAAGTHWLTEPVELGPRDSDLTIEGPRDGPAIISGGRRVTGWRPWKGDILQADLSALDLPDTSFRELYYNGKLMPWARVPNFDTQHPRTGGFLQNAAVVEAGTKTRFRYREGELDPGRWAHPERAWIMFHDSLNYETQFCPVKAIDPEERVVEAERGVYALSQGNPYYLCGILEELDSPGEWCVDPGGKTLYFWPPEGDPNGEDSVVVPALSSAFMLEGDAEQDEWVEDIRIDQLYIRDLRGRAISMSGARRCTVAACDLRNAEVGVYIGDDTHACRVLGCDITQTQGDGVSILGTTPDQEQGVRPDAETPDRKRMDSLARRGRDRVDGVVPVAPRA